MFDREKVIEGLHEAAAYFRSSFDAMYGTVACEKFRSWTDAIEQALTLLKEQESRVLALDGIHRGMVVWLEDKDKPDTVLAIGGASAGKAKCFITVDDTSVRAWDDEYNVRWRAWTLEPTYEQRKEVEWNA